MSEQSDWVAAAAAHLATQSEDSLSRAYELGRRALAQGMGILDVLSLYGSVQAELVLTAPAAEQGRRAAAVGDFFRELLSVYEMSFRGYREANSQLKRVNEDLTAAYAQLQQKQLQLVQAAKMASLGELVAGIAHEVNNPLAFVASHLRTIGNSLSKVEAELDQPLPAAAREHWERARNRVRESEAGAERIRELVVKLRTFSRLDEGTRKEVSIKAGVASVLMILEHRFKGKAQVQTHFGHPDVIECFPSLLNQAVMNLVSNAIDAVEVGGTIWVTTGADMSDYVIAVADTGHGIDAALRERVLEPFFTTKPVGEGTGLGLSITDSIARTHGGSLVLSDRQGGGTIATIRFPLVS